MTAVIKPPPLRPAVEGGYTLDDFDIDEDAGTVTCPAGITVQLTARRRARFGRHCATCLLRDRCTTPSASLTKPTTGPSPDHARVLGPVKEGRLYGTKACAAGSTLNTGSSDS